MACGNKRFTDCKRAVTRRKILRQPAFCYTYIIQLNISLKNITMDIKLIKYTHASPIICFIRFIMFTLSYPSLNTLLYTYRLTQNLTILIMPGINFVSID